MKPAFHTKRPAPRNQISSDAELVENIVELWEDALSVEELGEYMKDMAFKFTVADPEAMRSALTKRIPNKSFVDYVMASFILERHIRNNALSRCRINLFKSYRERHVQPVVSKLPPTNVRPALQERVARTPDAPVEVMRKAIEDIVTLATSLSGRSASEVEENVLNLLQQLNLPAVYPSLTATEQDLERATKDAKPAAKFFRKDVLLAAAEIVAIACLFQGSERAELFQKAVKELVRILSPDHVITRFVDFITQFGIKRARNPEDTFVELMDLVKGLRKERHGKIAVGGLLKLADRCLKDGRWKKMTKGVLTTFASVKESLARQWFEQHGLAETNVTSEEVTISNQILAIWSEAPKPLSLGEIEALKDLIQNRVVNETQVGTDLDALYSRTVSQAIKSLLTFPSPGAVKELKSASNSPFCESKQDSYPGHLVCNLRPGTTVSELFSGLVCAIGRVIVLGLDAQEEFRRIDKYFDLSIENSQTSRKFIQDAAKVIDKKFNVGVAKSGTVADMCFEFLSKLPKSPAAKISTAKAMTANATVGPSKAPVAETPVVLSGVNAPRLVIETNAPVPQIPSALLASFVCNTNPEAVVQELCNLLAHTREGREIAELARDVAIAHGIKIRESSSFDAFLLVLVMRTVGVSSKDSVESISKAVGTGFRSIY